MRATVTPVWTYLSDLSLLDREKIDRYFAVKVPGVMCNPKTRRMILTKQWDGCFHFYDKKQNRLQSGLLAKLRAVVPGLQVENQTMEHHMPAWEAAKVGSYTVEVNGITYSQDQRRAIISAIQNVRGIMKLATNSGKTEVGAGVVKVLGLKALWIIHLKGLLHQTAERLETRIGVPVGKIGDGLDKPQALVDVAMMQSVKYRTKEWRQRLEKYDVLIFDEAHHLCSDTQQSIAKACINAPFRYAFGGSFPQEDIKKFKIMAATDATLLYDLTNKELIASGWSATPTVHLQSINHPGFDDSKYIVEQEIENDCDPAPGDVDGVETEPETMRRVLYYKIDEDLISMNPKVDAIVTDEVERYMMKGMTTLVLVDRLAHGQRLGKILGGKGIRYEFLNGAATSEFREGKLREFKSGLLPVIIATSILDEGIDVPRVQCVVLAGGGKSSVKLLQRIGRALRRKTGIGENVAHIVDFMHFGSKYTRRHAQERRKVYETEGFEIIDEGRHTL